MSPRNGNGKECDYHETNPAALLELGRPLEPTIIDADQFIFVAGDGNLPLARKLTRELTLPIHEPIGKQSDGETKVRFGDVNFRGRDVFIFNAINIGHQNDVVMDTVNIADAVRRSNARNIDLLFSALPYMRQERKDQPHVPISGPNTLQLLVNEANARSVILIEPHAENIAGAVDCPVDILPGSYALIPAIYEHLGMKAQNQDGLNSSVGLMLSPDEGALKRTAKLSKKLVPPPLIASMAKIRNVTQNDTIDTLGIVGLNTDQKAVVDNLRAQIEHIYLSRQDEFKQAELARLWKEISTIQNRGIDMSGLNILILDDLIASGSTLRASARKAKEHGAAQVIVAATHATFPVDPRVTYDNLMDEAIDKVFITDTVHQEIPEECKEKIEVVSVAPMLAEAIKRNYTGASLSKEFYDSGNPAVKFV